MKASTRRLLRWITGGLILVLLAATAAIVATRLRPPKAALAEVATAEVERSGSDQVEGIYTGFRYAERVAGKLVFALRSAKTLGKSSGWYDIQGVRLQLYDHGEAGPVVTCEAARFNVENRDALLEGPVQVEFPGGGMLTTAHGRFDAASRSFITDAKVMFTDGESVGQAGRASYSLESNRLELTGDAILRSGEGVSLKAPVIAYARAADRVEFPDGVSLEQEGSVVTAPQAVMDVEKGGGPPQRIVLKGGVSIKRAPRASGSGVEAWAERIVAERDANDNWQIAARTSGRWIEVSFLNGPGFFRRTLQALSLRGVISRSGEVLNLRAEQRVCLDEVPTSGPRRRARAQNARAWFADGEATDVELDGEVVVSGQGMEARGQRARLSSSAGLVMIQGDPVSATRAVIISEQGRVSCDQAQFFTSDERVEARGNVQGTLQDVQVLGTEAGQEDVPVHFAAGVLDISENGGVYHMRENARLWQGHRLLLADDLIYHEQGEALDASGHVRTTMPAVQLDPEAKPGDDVVVVARSLKVDRTTGIATFSGNVRYSDPSTMLTASQLAITFDASRKIRKVKASGGVELVDLVENRRMTGQEAVRDVDSQTVVVTGSPVKLTDADGTSVSSSSLTWDQASGTVTVAGGTETIYYPEDAP